MYWLFSWFLISISTTYLLEPSLKTWFTATGQPLAVDGHGPEHCGRRPLFFSMIVQYEVDAVESTFVVQDSDQRYKSTKTNVTISHYHVSLPSSSSSWNSRMCEEDLGWSTSSPTWTSLCSRHCTLGRLKAELKLSPSWAAEAWGQPELPQHILPKLSHLISLQNAHEKKKKKKYPKWNCGAAFTYGETKGNLFQ